MNYKDLSYLQEAYLGVYQNLDESDEARVRSPGDPFAKKTYRKDVVDRARERAALAKKQVRTQQQESYDLYDVVLSHLLDEGYADTYESAEAIMVNMSEEWIDSIIDEEVEQLDEISKGTAIRAYASGRSSEFEGQDSPKEVERNNRLIGRIERKFGPDTAKHAERAADAKTFGRGTPRPLSKPMSSNQRTTKAGKLHGQDQRALKTKLQARLASRRSGETSVKDRPSFYNP